jgi:hypothetical protein
MFDDTRGVDGIRTRDEGFADMRHSSFATGDARLWTCFNSPSAHLA